MPATTTTDSAFEIVVDTRERELPAALAASGAMTTSVSPLDVGDVEVWVGGERALVVERKTLSDLAASVKDGRYAEQKARMLATTEGGAVVMYAIEVGSFATAFAFDGRMRDGLGGLPAATLQGCVVSMLLDARSVLTRDVADTAAFVLRAARRLAKRAAVARTSYADCAAAASVAPRKRDNVDPAACFRHQIAQLPGVSVKLAGTVCDAFGSMGALYARLLPLPDEERVAAFAALPLIGPKKAAQLVKFMFPAT
jgi:ERCC4-type nuclease